MTKIEALRKTIYNLENDVYRYSWTNFNHCNCGVLSQTILDGRLPESCGYHESPSVKTGNPLSVFAKHAVCMKTDTPLPLMFQRLKETGFTYEEIQELELLANKKITDLAGIETHYFHGMFRVGYGHDKKENLIRYLKAWVEILEQEQQSKEQEDKRSVANTLNSNTEAKPIKEKIRYVSVSETIKEERKELILN